MALSIVRMLAHACHQGDLLAFAYGQQALIAGLERWIVGTAVSVAIYRSNSTPLASRTCKATVIALGCGDLVCGAGPVTTGTRHVLHNETPRIATGDAGPPSPQVPDGVALSAPAPL